LRPWFAFIAGKALATRLNLQTFTLIRIEAADKALDKAQPKMLQLDRSSLNTAFKSSYKAWPTRTQA